MVKTRKSGVFYGRQLKRLNLEQGSQLIPRYKRRRRKRKAIAFYRNDIIQDTFKNVRAAVHAYPVCKRCFPALTE